MGLAAALWSAPIAHAAFGIKESSFEAGTCTVSSCTYSTTEDFYTQAAGHPPYGITSFEVNSQETLLGTEPEGALKRIRVDIPPGLAADPQAIETCSRETFEKGACPLTSQAGTTEMEASALGIALPLEGKVYNLEQPLGLPLDFGIEVAPLSPLVAPVRLYLEGHVDWSGDYHEYFEINNVPREAEILGGTKVPLGVLKSKLIFEGQKGGDFLTVPSVCSASTTSHLLIESYEGAVSETYTHTPVGVEGCGNVPFSPVVGLTPENKQSDQPDGATVELQVPQATSATEINSSNVNEAVVSLPEGMTLNPSIANGLKDCSLSQLGIGTTNKTECPAQSQIGTVAIETPDLPAGSLTGQVYVGAPECPASGCSSQEVEEGKQYRIYLATESERYDVKVRLKGTVSANSQTGRLTATFSENPQLPFSDLIVKFNGGSKAPLGNPLSCGPAVPAGAITPYSAPMAKSPSVSGFIVDSNNKGAACPAPLPFSLSQSTSDLVQNLPSSSPTAGAYADYALSESRADGQQYLGKISSTLPEGLLGAIPSISLCGEPQAGAGTCPPASQIGTAAVTVGLGAEPYALSGPVYLTGPYNGAPYGLSVAIPATSVGPYNLGTVVARATINVNASTAALTATSSIPTIVGGVPLRLKTLTVAVTKANFLFNPTNCAPIATSTILTSTFNAVASPLTSPFQVTGCGSLAFTPKFSAATSAKTSIKSGASLKVKITQAAHQSNIHEVIAVLPKQLSARLRPTLQHACTEAQFAANPYGCPEEAKVGTVLVSTPVLANKLEGPAYFVSHGGAAFPNLDFVLSDKHGVNVILIGLTNITGTTTTSTFNTVPDAPISSVEVNLPVGPHSALSANGNFCKSSLIMPTTIVAQGGQKITQNTKLSVTECPITITKHKISGHTASITGKVPAAGRVSVSGTDLKRITKKAGKAGTFTVKVKLSKNGLAVLDRKGKLKIKARVGFLPNTKHPTSKAFVTLVFKR
jgi:hypothetical protein